MAYGPLIQNRTTGNYLPFNDQESRNELIMYLFLISGRRGHYIVAEYTDRMNKHRPNFPWAVRTIYLISAFHFTNWQRSAVRGEIYSIISMLRESFAEI